LPEDQLIEKIRDVQAIGIRSKTRLSENVLKHAQNLVCIGCFCIGTNQVDLEYAAKRGIAVFNSPFSNSRSVAELVISEIIALSRQYVERTVEMRQGMWNKVSNKCWEIRGKTLGITLFNLWTDGRDYWVWTYWKSIECSCRKHGNVSNLLRRLSNYGIPLNVPSVDVSPLEQRSNYPL